MEKVRQTLVGLLVVSALVLLVTGPAPCSVTGTEESAAAKGTNAFAIDLYGKIRKPEGNLIFSPYSVSTALAMAYVGARGRTESQMAKTLHFSGERGKVNQGFHGLTAQVLSARKEKQVEINIANALWAEKSYPISKEYLESIRLNFTQPGGFSQLPVV